MAGQSCKLCHYCGEKVEMKDGNEKCPNEECKTVQTPHDHANMGITTCQFARLLMQLNVLTNIMYRIGYHVVPEAFPLDGENDNGHDTAPIEEH